MRFIGIKNNKIVMISDKNFSSEGVQVVKASEELNNISNSELIINYKLRNNDLVSKKSVRKASELKVAIVSNWMMQCGLSQYCQSIIPELAKSIKEFKLFIEKNDNPTGPLNIVGDLVIPNENIITCWERGKSLQSLVSEVKSYDPDIILINHEFGLFPNAANFISMMSQFSDYRVITVMHSVFRHMDKLIEEAAMPEIIVHLQGAKDVLINEKNVNGKVYVINHGCFPCVDKTRLWNFYKSEHTFIQQGYLFRYKGYEQSIKATAILKDKYPDVFFTGLCSVSNQSLIENEMYFNELMELVDKLGLQENVGLIKGYQSDVVIDSYLRTNKAAVFPYIENLQHLCFGSSGAAPTSMAKAIPVITSNGNHFKSLPTIKANTPEEIAVALDKLFSDKKFANEQVEKQNKYLEDNSWKNTATKYINIFENKVI